MVVLPEHNSRDESGWLCRACEQNALPFAVNLQPGGGLLQLLPVGNDTGSVGAPVPPNATVTYVWTVPAAAGPGEADFSAVAYTYHSSVDPTAHQNAGLIGAIVVGRRVRCLEPSCETLPAIQMFQNCPGVSQGHPCAIWENVAPTAGLMCCAPSQCTGLTALVAV